MGERERKVSKKEGAHEMDWETGKGEEGAKYECAKEIDWEKRREG